MWVLCAYVCGQVHAVWHRWSVGASGGAQGHRTVRGTLTVKGQGGASCGLGLDDVAVRDLHTRAHARGARTRDSQGRGARSRFHSLDYLYHPPRISTITLWGPAFVPLTCLEFT